MHWFVFKICEHLNPEFVAKLYTKSPFSLFSLDRSCDVCDVCQHFVSNLNTCKQDHWINLWINSRHILLHFKNTYCSTKTNASFLKNLEIVEKSTATNRQSLSVLTLNLINIIHAGKPLLLFRKFLRSGIVHFYIKLWTLETRANI